MDNRGTPRTDRTPAEREADRARSVWESSISWVSQCYAELERAIHAQDAAEHAFNLAQRAAKLDRTGVAAVVLAAFGALSGDPVSALLS